LISLTWVEHLSIGQPYRSLCSLAVGDPNTALELLDGTAAPALPPESILASAYQITGCAIFVRINKYKYGGEVKVKQEKTAVKKRLTLFVVLTFVITWIVFLLIPLRGLTYGKGVSIFIVMAGMFIPPYATY
jgi:hypothetical protein